TPPLECLYVPVLSSVRQRSMKGTPAGGPSGRCQPNLLGAALEMRFDFFQSFALCFWKEERGSDEVDYGAAGKSPKHGGVTILADRGQEDRGDAGRDSLINQERNAHTVRPDAGWHQFRKRQPHAHTGADGKEGHENEKCDGDHPSAVRAGQGSDQ